MLLTGIPLFSLVVYWFSLSQTVESYHQVKRMEARLDSAHTAPAVYEKLRAEGRLYEQKFKRISTKGIEWQGKLTQQVTSICQQNNVMLMELPTPVQEVQNGYGIQTSIIKLAGTYLNLVQSVYDLEETPAVGRVASLNFVTETDRKTKKMTLHAYIYLQNIERGGSNEF